MAVKILGFYGSRWMSIMNMTKFGFPHGTALQLVAIVTAHWTFSSYKHLFAKCVNWFRWSLSGLMPLSLRYVWVGLYHGDARCLATAQAVRTPGRWTHTAINDKICIATWHHPAIHTLQTGCHSYGRCLVTEHWTCSGHGHLEAKCVN